MKKEKENKVTCISHEADQVLISLRITILRQADL